jgi:hypothetical protein
MLMVLSTIGVSQTASLSLVAESTYTQWPLFAPPSLVLVAHDLSIARIDRDERRLEVSF